MSEVTPTMENLTDPYVLQLIEALAKQDDEIERLTADNEMLRDELEQQYAKVEELEAIAYHYKMHHKDDWKTAYVAATEQEGE